MKIKPLSGYILVKPLEKEAKTAEGLYLPDTAQQQINDQGTVYAIGKDKNKCPVKVNDLVLFKKWAGDDVKVDGKEYKLVKFEDLMAVIDAN